MSAYEVPEPIINSPFVEPSCHWHIEEGQEPEKRPGRRPAVYYYRDPKAKPSSSASRAGGTAVDMPLVNLIRQRVQEWRNADYPGVTRTTLDLLKWWRRERDDPHKRQFFCQIEAVETMVFLVEARSDLRQGIQVPRDEPSDDQIEEGIAGFMRYACKMATGTGKTTVMAMLAAWSILNKVNNKSDSRFSDTVMVVCPNVTIRGRLREINPEEGEASIYWTRELVPPSMRQLLTQGKVLVTNWHVFEPQTCQVGGVSGRVMKVGQPVKVRETIVIGGKTTTARGNRYMTMHAFETMRAAGGLSVVPGSEEHDEQGNLKKVKVESEKYVESDTALLNRVLGREVGGKQNILVLNDEAHHAYRIKREDPDEDEEGLFEGDEDAEEFFKEATVWIDGLDRINKQRGINLCVDLSATPYFLGRVGQDTNRPFPWVVSAFDLTDAIESGLVKIPQLAVRDTTGAEIPGYFNIWHWIINEKLTKGERGGKRANPKVEAILKYADHPIRMLAAEWEEECERWKEASDKKHPVFIIVCKTTQLAKVLYEWLAEDKPPTGIPSAKIEGFRNIPGKQINTIRVDTKVVHDTDSGSGAAKSAEMAWMRFTLDTVGRQSWTKDRQGRPIYPEGFEELADKLKKEKHPPGRDVHCIISVGMLTEGWDCVTVTHIVGLRPFMSQLLCEQVVGRGLRRARQEYQAEHQDFYTEEVAKVFGVPFEVVPFKANKQAAPPPPVKRHHVQSIPARAQYQITFPRVEGYTQAIRNRVTVEWDTVPPLVLVPDQIPPEVEVKGLLINNQGKLTLSGPGRIDEVTLREFREKRRLQELTFDLARTLTRDFVTKRPDEVPAHVLFPQLVAIVRRYLETKVKVQAPADRKDLFLAPYYGWVVERLLEAIRPDTSQGEAPEVPRYEENRAAGSTADVDFWTSRDVREVLHSHVNYVVADTQKWEQQAAYHIDKHPAVAAAVKNAGLYFTIPYFHNGQMRDYIPDFIIRLKTEPVLHLILEVKGYDELEAVKREAAERWVAAVNEDGQYGRWAYRVAKSVSEVASIIGSLAEATG